MLFLLLARIRVIGVVVQPCTKNIRDLFDYLGASCSGFGLLGRHGAVPAALTGNTDGETEAYNSRIELSEGPYTVAAGA